MAAKDTTSLPAERYALVAALFGLVVLYALWFRDDAHRLAAWLVFGAPPLLLGIGVLARRGTARFWSGVFGLAWFSHGVMTLWAHADARTFGLIETVLALIAIFAGNASGLRARFARRRP